MENQIRRDTKTAENEEEDRICLYLELRSILNDRWTPSRGEFSRINKVIISSFLIICITPVDPTFSFFPLLNGLFASAQTVHMFLMKININKTRNIHSSENFRLHLGWS